MQALQKLLFQSAYKKEPLSTFAFGLGRAKFLAVGYLIPLVYLLPVYLIVWLIFNNFPNSEYVAELITVMPNMTEAKAILFIVGASAAIGVLGTAITGALGEELGWRGFLVPKLLQIHSFHKTSLFIGVVWSIWHLPIILFSDYFRGPNLYWGIVGHTLLVFALSYVLTWLFIQSQSIWPACLLHASHNVFSQQVLSPLTIPTETSGYIIGDFGLGVAISSCVVAIIILSVWKVTKTSP